MSRMIFIKDLAKNKPGINSLIMASMGKTDITDFDKNKTYIAGDRVYFIDKGTLIVKECMGNGIIGMDSIHWITVESGLGGSSPTQNPEMPQSISSFEKKLVSDISSIVKMVSPEIDISQHNLQNIYTYPLYDRADINILKGTYEFGRIFI